MHIRNVDSSKTQLCRTSFFFGRRDRRLSPVVMAMIPSSGPNSKAEKRFRSNHIRFAPRQSGTVMVMRPPVSTPQTNARNCFDVVHMLSHVSGVNLIGAVGFEPRQSGNVFVTIGSHLAIAVDIDITFW
jgi:hypothetical protein